MKPLSLSRLFRLLPLVLFVLAVGTHTDVIAGHWATIQGAADTAGAFTQI